MRSFPRYQPSPSLVISCLALFVALSGTAVALSRGEVKSKHIAPRAVAAKHIKARHVRTGKLANAAVTRAKLREGAVGTNELGKARGVSGFSASLSIPAGGCRWRSAGFADPGTLAYTELLSEAPSGVFTPVVVTGASGNPPTVFCNANTRAVTLSSLRYQQRMIE